MKITVYGTPAPQGSKTRMPNGAIVEGATRGQRELHINWRHAVATAAAQALDEHGGQQLAAPITMHIGFLFPMPASRPKRVRDKGFAWKTTAPDLDKLVRATCDALQASGLIANDSHIVMVSASKQETIGRTGADITIGTLSDG